jgi:hypothetical protein
MGLHEVEPSMLQTPIKPMAKGFTVCKKRPHRYFKNPLGLYLPDMTRKSKK